MRHTPGAVSLGQEFGVESDFDAVELDSGVVDPVLASFPAVVGFSDPALFSVESPELEFAFRESLR